MKKCNFPLKSSLAYLVLLGLVGFGGPVAASETTKASTAEPSFKKFDANGDGCVQRDEWRNMKRLTRSFDEADGNKDGCLDQDEFIKAYSLDQRLKAERFVEDSAITAKVKAGLVKNLVLKSLTIHVDTYFGIVQLSGFVDDEKQVRKAAEVAAGVTGVVSVRNNLIVKELS